MILSQHLNSFGDNLSVFQLIARNELANGSKFLKYALMCDSGLDGIFILHPEFCDSLEKGGEKVRREKNAGAIYLAASITPGAQNSGCTVNRSKGLL